MHPLAGTSWNNPATVAGFRQSPPNYRLIDYAKRLQLPLRELNVPPTEQARIAGAPVIFEGGFRFAGA